MKKQKYCSYCGSSLLELIFEIDHYDVNTGKPIIKRRFQCEKRHNEEITKDKLWQIAHKNWLDKPCIIRLFVEEPQKPVFYHGPYKIRFVDPHDYFEVIEESKLKKGKRNEK